MKISAIIKQQLKQHLTPQQINLSKQLACRLFWRQNLQKLAAAYGSDKQNAHFYAKHYQYHFAPLCRKQINLLEIGIGGYQDPKDGGNSLRMWKAYFPKARIFGIDIFDKSYHDEHRIQTYVGSQVDVAFLRKVAADIGRIDVIIDDGSHYSNHVIETFKILFPLLDSNGIYAIEDLQTSYWDEVNGEKWGGSRDLKAPHTSMNFLKSLADGLNYEEFTIDNYTPSYFDKNIVSMHFYHNLLFVYKGKNCEGSNVFGRRFQ